jgi:NTP pyrophosphatase (non-canonical NTP hydrolase)
MIHSEIIDWHKKTFPTSTSKSMKRKVLEGAAELMTADILEEGEEMADVAIVLIAIAGRAGWDLQKEIDKKMAINIERAKTGRWEDAK